MSTKRKELRSNDLADALEGKMEDFKPHMKTFGIAAIALVLIGLAGFFFFNNMKVKRERQWGDFFIAQNNAAISANSKELENISEEHPGTEAEAWSRQLVADKNLAEALRTFFSNREEGTDDLKEVVDEYTWVLDESGFAGSGSMLRRAALFGRAQAYEGLFDASKAIEDYKTIESEFAETKFAEFASKKIKLIESVNIKDLETAFNTIDPGRTGETPSDRYNSIPAIPDISFPQTINDIGNQGTTEGLVPAGTGETGGEGGTGNVPPLNIPGSNSTDDSSTDDSTGTGSDDGAGSDGAGSDDGAGKTGDDNTSDDGNSNN